MIHRNQAEYYAAINRSTAVADSKAFIEFMLRMIRDAVTIAELARTTGLSARTIERNIKALRNQGRLLRIGPDKGGHWKVMERES